MEDVPAESVRATVRTEDQKRMFDPMKIEASTESNLQTGAMDSRIDSIPVDSKADLECGKANEGVDEKVAEAKPDNADAKASLKLQDMVDQPREEEMNDDCENVKEEVDLKANAAIANAVHSTSSESAVQTSLRKVETSSEACIPESARKAQNVAKHSLSDRSNGDSNPVRADGSAKAFKLAGDMRGNNKIPHTSQSEQASAVKNAATGGERRGTASAASTSRPSASKTTKSVATGLEGNGPSGKRQNPTTCEPFAEDDSDHDPGFMSMDVGKSSRISKPIGKKRQFAIHGKVPDANRRNVKVTSNGDVPTSTTRPNLMDSDGNTAITDGAVADTASGTNTQAQAVQGGTVPDNVDEEDLDAWLAANGGEAALPTIEETSTDVDETLVSARPTARKRIVLQTANAQPEVTKLDSYKTKRMRFIPGQCVELVDGSFLTISAILKRVDNDQVLLRGREYRRMQADPMQEPGELLPREFNEVYCVCEQVETSTEDLALQSLKDVSVEDAAQERFIQCTNKLYPALSCRDDPNWVSDLATLSTEAKNERLKYMACAASLVCRMKRTSVFANENDRLLNRKPVEQSWIRLTANECDPGEESVLDPRDLRKRWRGPTRKGGLCVEVTRGEKEFQRQEYINSNGKRCRQSLETATKKYPLQDAMERRWVGLHCCKDDIVRNKNKYFSPRLSVCEAAQNKLRRNEKNQRVRTPYHIPQQRYEFADAFCGAGGMSRGAVMAGLKVVYGFDEDLDISKTYLANNFETMLYNLEADEFIRLPEHYDLRVDILHLSPPCQFFSPAHTRPGQHDEKNTATQFALQELIPRCKPRIITFEQTAGLVLQKKHRQYFDLLILSFITHNYNVRWRLLQCADYGVPQRRLRLFIIASCPGEPLPPFPKPTHAEKPGTSGLKPWETINTTLAGIPLEWSNHNITDTVERDSEPYPGNRVITCITTTGPNKIHPSGKRDFTDRELASLSGFPLCHKFRGRRVRKQIGNAVPPLVAKVLLTEVRKCLMRTDGLDGEGE